MSLCPSPKRIYVITFRAHLDNLYPKTLNSMTLFPNKVTQVPRIKTWTSLWEPLLAYYLHDNDSTDKIIVMMQEREDNQFP
jgi:hypothetical protein